MVNAGSRILRRRISANLLPLLPVFCVLKIPLNIGEDLEITIILNWRFTGWRRQFRYVAIHAATTYNRLRLTLIQCFAAKLVQDRKPPFLQAARQPGALTWRYRTAGNSSTGSGRPSAPGPCYAARLRLARAQGRRTGRKRSTVAAVPVVPSLFVKVVSPSMEEPSVKACL